MAVALRDFNTPLFVADAVDAIPGVGAEQQLGLYLVAKKSRNQAELPRPTRLHSAILTVGPDGIQPGSAWYGTKG